jgi:hypothetical protein
LQSCESTGGGIHFYILPGSSGVGKTQLAFSLDDIPIIYIPLRMTQTVYTDTPFDRIQHAIMNEVKVDFDAFKSRKSSSSYLGIQELFDSRQRFFTASLIIELIILMMGKEECQKINFDLY